MGAPVRIQIVDQPDVFGLEHVRIDEVAETYDAVRCRGRVLPNVRPSCPACGDGRKPSVHDYYVHEIADTPMRGRKTILELEFPRFRHRCGQTLDGPRPSFLHRDLNATKRLVRYVEGQTFRRPVLDISREVGLPEPEVRKLASKLAHRLHHRHRFPTPAVLAIDDLHIRRRLYTVVTDAISGRAIALVEGGTYEVVRDELRRRDFDFAAVRCIVTDMSGSNKKVVERLFKTVGAVHVADKWHVLRYAQKALARVISQEISRLEKPAKGTPPNEVAEMKAKAATIRDARRQLMGSRLKVSALFSARRRGSSAAGCLWRRESERSVWSGAPRVGGQLVFSACFALLATKLYGSRSSMSASGSRRGSSVRTWTNQS